MTTRVLKWPLLVNGRDQWIGQGPVVHIDRQGADPKRIMVWTQEKDTKPPTRRVRVFATGQDIPKGWRHVGTALVYQGAIVWHVFEAPE